MYYRAEISVFLLLPPPLPSVSFSCLSFFPFPPLPSFLRKRQSMPSRRPLQYLYVYPRGYRPTQSLPSRRSSSTFDHASSASLPLLSVTLIAPTATSRSRIPRRMHRSFPSFRRGALRRASFAFVAFLPSAQPTVPPIETSIGRSRESAYLFVAPPHLLPIPQRDRSFPRSEFAGVFLSQLDIAFFGSLRFGWAFFDAASSAHTSME